ncbi:MAG TPA: hypothetical protein VND66_08070 [Acidobacteriaceae bacterium]|nr:hypothetical protein [Acidobacteriaceae bacterium]
MYSQPSRKKVTSAPLQVQDQLIALSAAVTLHRSRVFAAMQFNIERRERSASLRAVILHPDATHASAGNGKAPERFGGLAISSHALIFEKLFP